MDSVRRVDGAGADGALALIPPHTFTALGFHRQDARHPERFEDSLRQEFPSLKSRIPTLWTNSYFVATVGGASLAVVERYVEDQRGV